MHGLNFDNDFNSFKLKCVTFRLGAAKYGDVRTQTWVFLEFTNTATGVVTVAKICS